MSIFKKKHNYDLYISLLKLSRNIFFYKSIGLKDNFETRIYLMFFHFAILLLIYKSNGKKFNQSIYDDFFQAIENDLREIGHGDVYVNKKMKDLNKILYDILLKIEFFNKDKKHFDIDKVLVHKYFDVLKNNNSTYLVNFSAYFIQFYHFCFDISDYNMIESLKKFKY